MSWLDASEYGPFERANGIRLPPRIAARRGWALPLEVAMRRASLEKRR
jgi:hypothetical protein